MNTEKPERKSKSYEPKPDTLSRDEDGARREEERRAETRGPITTEQHDREDPSSW